MVPVRVKETSRRVQMRCRRSRDSNGPFRRNRLEGQPEIIILREYRARILTRYRDARSGSRYVDRLRFFRRRNPFLSIARRPRRVLADLLARSSALGKIESTLDRTLHCPSDVE